MLYGFGDCEIDIARGEVRRGEHVTRLQPKVCAVLQYLLDRPGQIVSADELIDRIWEGQVIEPVGVARNIAQIRRALGDDSQNPTYIETIPKRGYRTMAVVMLPATPAPADSTPETSTHPKRSADQRSCTYSDAWSTTPSHSTQAASYH